MAYDALDRYVVAFGFGPGHDETWTFASQNWTRLSPSPSPPGRMFTTMAYDAADGYAVLFGGRLLPSAVDANDTWTFSGGQWSRRTPAVSPPAREKASMAYDALAADVLLYGGVSLTDTWTFSGGTWTRLPIGPFGAPPADTSMAYDSGDGYVVLFGGQVPGFSSSATFGFQAGNWSALSPPVSPPGRSSAGMAYDTLDNYLLLFGGCSCHEGQGPDVLLNDTWKFAGGWWTSITSGPAPAPRRYPGMASDPRDFLVVLAGGENFTFQQTSFATLNDTWTFAAGTWSLAARGTSLSGLPAPGPGFDPLLAAWVLAVVALTGGGALFVLWSRANRKKPP